MSVVMANPNAEEWPDYCQCWQCNPLVKDREKTDLPPCPATGLGFIGPVQDLHTGSAGASDGQC